MGAAPAKRRARVMVVSNPTVSSSAAQTPETHRALRVLDVSVIGRMAARGLGIARAPIVSSCGGDVPSAERGTQSSAFVAGKNTAGRNIDRRAERQSPSNQQNKQLISRSRIEAMINRASDDIEH